MIKYVFDANIFINLQRRQPIDIFPSLWDKISELMKNGIVISSMEVYEEIAIGSDELNKWAKTNKEYFLPSVEEVQIGVREILKRHRGLVEGGKKKNSADPFVIELARENNCKVVTEETRSKNPNSPKIPDVCIDYNIPCITFVDFAREEKLNF